MHEKPRASPAHRAQVAERAYFIWQKAGRPDGRDIAHWLRAEAELSAEAGPPARRRRQVRKATVKKARAEAEPASGRPKKARAKSEPTPSQPKKRGKSTAKGAARKTRRRPRPEA